jgi:DNA-binding XRE family transcriptional regulator
MKTDVPPEIAAAIRMRRVALEVSQDQAAVNAGIGRSTWNLIETGKARRVALKSIHAVYLSLGWTTAALSAPESSPMRSTFRTPSLAVATPYRSSVSALSGARS